MMKLAAGYGRIDITPPLGVELGGYGYFLRRRAEAVHDPLYARCLCLETDGERRYLLSCDLPGLTDGVFDALTGRHGEDTLMVVCTHTHTGVATLKAIGCGEHDPGYLASLPGLLERAMEAAGADCRPVSGMRCGKAIPDEPIGYNRAGLDCLNNEAGGFTLLRQDAAPITVVRYGCHPVTVGRSAEVSADYPGAAIAALEADGRHALFVGGPSGDVDPVSNRAGWGSGTWDTVAHYGRLIARAWKRAEGASGISPAHPVASRRFTVRLPLRGMSPQEMDALVARIEAGGDEGHARTAHIWRERMQALQTPGFGCEEAARLTWLRVGQALLVAVPYEIFTEIGRAVEAAFPGLTVLVLGNADATQGYLPMGDGGRIRSYESIDSALVYGRLPFAAGAAEALVEQAVAALKRAGQP